MKKLEKTDYQLLTNILSMDQEGLRRVLAKYLKKKYDTVHVTNSYLYAEGNIPIALVAHMDTVFDKPPKEIYYDERKGVMWSPKGLGADDRAGVFAILKILLTTKLRPSIIFTTDEEIGGIGAKRFISDFDEPAAPVKFLIELDRCGVDDCVFYDCDNDDFVDYIEDFGFEEAWGSFSDISIISPAWKILSVNLSIGYRDEHSKSEILHIPTMLNTISKVKTILEEKNIPSFEYKEHKSSYFSYLYPTEEYMLHDYIETCNHCGALAYTYEMIPVRTVRNADELEYLCPECAEKHVDWCVKCGNPYLTVDDIYIDNGMCPYCNEKEHNV